MRFKDRVCIFVRSEKPNSSHQEREAVMSGTVTGSVWVAVGEAKALPC